MPNLNHPPGRPTTLAQRRPLHLHRLGPSLAAAPQTGPAVAGGELLLDIQLPTADAQSGLRFAALRSGRGKAIVVSAVLPGSAAAAAGVRPGLQLLAVSDPIREHETWPLVEGSSLRYVRDAVRMRRSATITLALSSQPIPEWTAAGDAPAAAAAARDGGGGGGGSSFLDAIVSDGESSSDEGVAREGRGMTIAEQLERRHAQQEGAATAAAARMQRRRDYMEEAGGRNDGPFFAGVAALFVLPALVILGVAASSGYLDTLAAGVLRAY